jgi:predicted amidohydrolase
MDMSTSAIPSRKEQTLHICLIQYDIGPAANNVLNITRIVKETPADIYVLPELFAVGFDASRPKEEYKPLAEHVSTGKTYVALRAAQSERPNSTLVYGLLEKDNEHYYNAAVVMTEQGSVQAYHQKYRVSTSSGYVLPVEPGEPRAVNIGALPGGHRPKIGLMICWDYQRAEEFFNHYSGCSVNAIVLIANSTATEWIETFSALCRNYNLPAIVCNAAGVNKGKSRVIDASGVTVGVPMSETAPHDVIELELPQKT